MAVLEDVGYNSIEVLCQLLLVLLDKPDHIGLLLLVRFAADCSPTTNQNI